MYTTHKEAFYFASWKALLICLNPHCFKKSLDFFCTPKVFGFIIPLIYKSFSPSVAMSLSDHVPRYSR